MRHSLEQIAVHLSGIAFVAIAAWLLGFSHETAQVAIVVAAGTVVVGWAVLGTLWWIIQFLMQDRNK